MIEGAVLDETESQLVHSLNTETKETLLRLSLNRLAERYSIPFINMVELRYWKMMPVMDSKLTLND